MREKTETARAFALAFALLILAGSPIFGGGPFNVNGLGQPMAWDTWVTVAESAQLGRLNKQLATARAWHG